MKADREILVCDPNRPNLASATESSNPTPSRNSPGRIYQTLLAANMSGLSRSLTRSHDALAASFSRNLLYLAAHSTRLGGSGWYTGSGGLRSPVRPARVRSLTPRFRESGNIGRLIFGMGVFRRAIWGGMGHGNGCWHP